MNHLTKVRIAYECSILGIILSIFLKSLYPSVMQTAGMVALIASLAVLWFSTDYLKRHNYQWAFHYAGGSHLYIQQLLKLQKHFQYITLAVLLIPAFVWQEALYDSRFIMVYILLMGMFLGVKLAVYTVEYAIYKSRR
mgnify:CR=1 FL=1